MSESWGGARTPSAPAAVSGPGALSARTDGGVLNPGEPEYGERQALENLRSAAPVAGAGGGRVSAPAAAPVDPLASIVGLGAPSTDPNTPVTAGANAGAGPDASVLGLPQSPGDEKRADARALGPAVQVLIAASQQGDASPSFRRLVREALYT